MSLRTQPPVITVTVDGQNPDARQPVSYPLVRRRVAPGRTLSWLGCDYQAGAIVQLRSDQAYPHEQTGVLIKMDGFA